MDKVMYAHLISLLDIYERNKKDCAGHDDYVYYSGACDALKKLKSKMDNYEAVSTIRKSATIESGTDR